MATPPLPATTVPAPRQRRTWKLGAPGCFALFLGGLVFLTYPGVILGLETWVARDFGFFSYPAAWYWRDSLMAGGQMPFWNPYNNCGMPFLALWNTLPLYPGSALFLIAPPVWAVPAFCLLHQWWGGIGMYVLLRDRGLHPAAPVAGAVAFTFNGLMLSCLMWPPASAALGWMPWVVWGISRYTHHGDRRTYVVACLAAAMQLFTGAPEIMLCTWLLVAVEALVYRQADAGVSAAPGGERGDAPTWATRAYGARLWATSGRGIWRLALVLVPALLLAAVQLLPFVQFALLSQRSTHYTDGLYSLTWRGLLDFVVPRAYTFLTPQGLAAQYDQYWVSSYYPGVLVLALAIVAVWGWTSWRVRAYGACVVLFVWLALGPKAGLYTVAHAVCPALGTIRFPVKFVVPVIFCLAVLAAYGVHRLLAGADCRSGRTTGGVRFLLVGTAMVAAAVFVALTVTYWLPMPQDDWRATLQNGLGRLLLLLLGTGLAAFLSRATRVNQYLPLEPTVARCPEASREGAGQAGGPVRAWSQRLLLAALVLTMWGDVRTHLPSSNLTAPPAVYASVTTTPAAGLALGHGRSMMRPETRDYLGNHYDPDPGTNYLVNRRARFANANLLDQVAVIDGFYALCPRWTDAVITRLYSVRGELPAKVLDFLGVSQMNSGVSVGEFESRPSALPLVTAGQEVMRVPPGTALPAFFDPRFDPRRLVFIEAGPELEDTARGYARPPGEETPAGSRPVSVLAPVPAARVLSPSWAAQRVEFTVDSPAPTAAVIAQSWYPCWRATVDGQAVPLWRANSAFQAVRVPAGRHDVVLVYRDRLFVAGAWISGVALLLLAGYYLHGVRRETPNRIAA